MENCQLLFLWRVLNELGGEECVPPCYDYVVHLVWLGLKVLERSLTCQVYGRDNCMVLARCRRPLPTLFPVYHRSPSFEAGNEPI